MSSWTFINHAFVPEEKALLHYRDLAIQRGYGVFDFLRVMNGIPLFIDDHLQRLSLSAERMRLKIPFSIVEIKEKLNELIEKNGINNGGIRITVTGGYSPDGYSLAAPNLIIAQHSFKEPSGEQFAKGIKLMTYPYQRSFPEAKTIDYSMAIWLQPMIREKNADDALYHQEGLISECPRSSFFIVTKDATLVTPQKNILRGVIRDRVLKIAKDFCTVEERDLTLEEAGNAREAFITSTTRLILPVRQIDDVPISGERVITTQLFQLLSQLELASSTKLG